MRGRVENGKGVYGVKVFDFARPKGYEEVSEKEANIDADISTGSPAILSNQSVAIFVLDVRTWKTPWKTSFEKYFPDFEGDYLGEEQWLWFENSIRRSNAAVNVIVNGLQVHAHRFLDGNTAESWSQYPRAQQRLFDAILQDSVQSPILISGDVHMTQLMRKDCARQGDHRPVRSLLEFTTSGMTHSWGGISSPLGELDYQPTLTQRLHSLTGISLIRILHKICPWTDLMYSDETHTENGGSEGSIQGLQYSLDMNFGELEFDWNERSVTFRSLGEQPNEPPLLAAKVFMDQLSGTSSMSKYYLSSDDYKRESQSWLYQQRIASNSNSEWICINHRGRDTVIQHLVGHAMSAAVLLTFFPLPLYLFIIVIFRCFRHWYSSDKARTQRKESAKTMKRLPKRASKKKAVFVYTRTIHRSSRRWKLGLRILGNSAWCENGQQIISAEIAEERPHRKM